MKNNKVLVVAAHPDDEVLGCGGSIALHMLKGDQLTVLIMADGVNSRDSKSQSQSVVERKKDAQQANNLLGVNNVILLSYPDNEMDTVSLLEITKDIERVIDDVKPNIIYTHSSML